MTKAIKSAVPVVSGIWLSLLGSVTTQAQVIPGIVARELTLSTLTPPASPPTVNSRAHVEVIDARNGRRLTTQLIMGHAISDITSQENVFEERVVSETGDASDQGTTSGVVGNCYTAAMSAHVNAYNLHDVWEVGPVCAERYEPPKPEIPDENCPVILDLQRDGFHLSGPDPAVHFDINADGTLDEIAWTKPGEDDAFLCMDRNGNGFIDDGRELFGFATLLLSGEPAIVGYRALADLDRPELGGNLDGKIDTSDQAFEQLCAWNDENRDGVSQPGEIHTLHEVGVVSLGYRYLETRIQDSFGNLFRYVSHVKMRSPSGLWPTFDVIFAE